MYRPEHKPVEKQVVALTNYDLTDSDWIETEKQYKEIILRLSFAVQGTDKKLDKTLDDLQQKLRQSDVKLSLKKISEDLYRSLMVSGNGAPTTSLTELDRHLQNLKLPDNLSEEWNKALKRTNKARTDEQTAEALEHCVSLLNQAIFNTDRKVALNGKSEKSFISRVFSSAKSASLSPELLGEIRVQLLRVLDNFESHSRFIKQVTNLKAQLKDDFSADLVPPVLDVVADLVHQMRDHVAHERKETEGFLNQMIENLKGIDQMVQDSAATYSDLDARRRAMDEVIEAETSRMDSMAQQATSLGTLKQSIQMRVSNIRVNMDQCHKAEEECRKKVKSELEILTNRVHEMEVETDDLRIQVHEEHKQTLLDPLTSIANRLAFDERMAHEYDMWKRYENPVSLLILDVDHFKSINDNYGHNSGDKALNIIARQLSKTLRSTDLLSRIGGEEFAVIMPGTDSDKALIAAEKLRKTVEQSGFHFRGEIVTITMSIGISEFKQGDNIEAVFERSDEALYKAKQNGRNRCEIL